MTTALDLPRLEFFGPEMNRPECVVATARGDLFASDGRGGVMHLRHDGRHFLILASAPPSDGFVPNGFALMRDRSLVCANMGLAGGVWQLAPDGELTAFLLEVDGEPLPQTNFVGLDDNGRIWITVSTRLKPVSACAYKGRADGFVVLVDDRGARVVADGLGLTNEAKVDPSGEWLYVVETIARRLSRFAIRPGGSLGPRQTVTEFAREGAFPDGLAFDVAGGVWVTTIIRNAVVQVTAAGEQVWHFEDVDIAHVAEVERIFQDGGFGGWEPGCDRLLQSPTSIAFTGPDLRTGVLGFLRGDRLARFASPVAGAAPAHWHF